MPESAKCFLCGDEVDGAGEWCFGCKHYICDKHPNDVWGSHRPEDHDDYLEDTTEW